MLYPPEHDSMDNYDEKCEYFEAFGFKSCWSMHEVDDIYDRHPYGNITHLEHELLWGIGNPKIAVRGRRWIDLWIAVDEAKARSGRASEFYLAIDGFSRVSHNTLRLYFDLGD